MPQERPPSRLLHRSGRTSRSRRREHVFICMFYPSAALNPTHPDRKVRSAARRRPPPPRRARVVAASRHRQSTDSPAKLCPKSTSGRGHRSLHDYYYTLSRISTARPDARTRVHTTSHNTHEIPKSNLIKLSVPINKIRSASKAKGTCVRS